MSFQWLKRYMPRGIYGRAALILILPVVTLQLVVSVVFIQRHFEGVSDQMTRDVARGVNLALRLQGSDIAGQVTPALDFTVTEADADEMPAADQRRWYDFSGIVVTQTLYDAVPGLQRVVLPTDRLVSLFVTRGGTLYLVSFDRRRASASNPHQLLVNMVFFGVLMTCIAFVYLRNQLRPITRLAEVAEAFGRGRHEDYSPSGAVEVRAAGNAFLDMRARIERQIEQRTMMLSGVSHDLRTPLTRMKLALSMLEHEDREPLERDVADMQRLIDAFLDFARGDAEAGVAEPTDPLALVAGIVTEAQRGGGAVSVVEAVGKGDISLRPTAMRRAIDNLIGNALRYGSNCEVSVVLSDKSLRIRVEDDGPGIPPERRDEAQRPFVRLDSARNQDKGSGVGLGLAITADIARAHGGVLRLGSSDRLGGLRADIVIAR
ncbi:ATP-binding protein [Puniceibacterium sp. IMCC21224]|uniref:ATP-binding protein n=1 Tax=Puniceibacterium sp. IMCC21224 TaxID=1618204 RepID=UPI00064D78E6|nr:ATP-binding protein [Puniceibacterium sp. IMCC21224]KMK66973.1 signal transduction histidine kinase [Puniceibacterium sp. IMCC21224]